MNIIKKFYTDNPNHYFLTGKTKPTEPRTYTHITNDMQRGAAEKIGGFMESATAMPTPEPPDPPEESRCKVIPFEKVV